MFDYPIGIIGIINTYYDLIWVNRPHGYLRLLRLDLTIDPFTPYQVSNRFNIFNWANAWTLLCGQGVKVGG